MRALGTSWRFSTHNSRPILIGIAVLLFITCVWLLVLRLSPHEPLIVDEAAKLNACRTNAITLIKPERMDVPFLANISDLCYGQVRGEDMLGDFHVRKLSLVQQQFDTEVLLWMVVIITISGVALAGFQLLAAYRLADLGRGELAQGGELSLDPKSLSLKSSVTGVVILTLSLAFFIIYVKWIYPIDTRSDPEFAAPNANTAVISRPNVPITLGVGGAGAAPELVSNPTPPQSNPTRPPPAASGEPRVAP